MTDIEDLGSTKRFLGGGCAIYAVIVVVVVLIIGGMYNSINSRYQAAKAGYSNYSAAVNMASQKIKGVWTMNKQFLEHEAATQKGVAEARSGYAAAMKAFQTVGQNGSLMDQTKAANQLVNAYSRFALAINVQVEGNVNLKGDETTKQAMRTMEEGTNEIATALRDWIGDIQEYNTYRGSGFVALVANSFHFPSKLDYYEGKIKEFNVDDLNPENTKK